MNDRAGQYLQGCYGVFDFIVARLVVVTMNWQTIHPPK